MIEVVIFNLVDTIFEINDVIQRNEPLILLIPIILIATAIFALFVAHYCLARRYTKAATYLNAVQTIVITIGTIERCLT